MRSKAGPLAPWGGTNSTALPASILGGGRLPVFSLCCLQRWFGQCGGRGRPEGGQQAQVVKEASEEGWGQGGGYKTEGVTTGRQRGD